MLCQKLLQHLLLTCLYTCHKDSAPLKADELHGPGGPLRSLTLRPRGSLVPDCVSDLPEGRNHRAKHRDMHLDESLAVLACSAGDDESVRSHGVSPEAPLEAPYSFNR